MEALGAVEKVPGVKEGEEAGDAGGHGEVWEEGEVGEEGEEADGGEGGEENDGRGEHRALEEDATFHIRHGKDCWREDCHGKVEENWIF